MQKIILADNQSVFRTGTAKVLSMEDEFHIIAQCPDMERAQRAISTCRDAIVLFGSTLKQDPETLMQQIRSMGSRGVAILESGESVDAYVAAKVHGVCFRAITARGLIECVRGVSRGEHVIQSSKGNSALSLSEDAVGRRVRDQLTTKEMKIVALIMQGCKNREIGRRLGTTEQVIKNYLRSVYDKTGVSDRLELALFAIHHRTLAEAATAAGKLIPTAA